MKRRVRLTANRHSHERPRGVALRGGSVNRSTGEPEKRSKHLRHVGWAVVLFLSVLLVSLFQRQSSTLTLSCFPASPRGDEPFVVAAAVNNLAGEPQTYSVRMFVDGVQVFAGESRLDASSTHSFTYTRPAPKPGSSVKIYAEAFNLETRARCSDVILVPASPPELWMSFTAFSAFAPRPFSSYSSAISSMLSIAYYQFLMGIFSSTQQAMADQSPIGVGHMMSIVLIGLLMFLQITEPSYRGIGRRIALLRKKYGLLVVSLLFVFVGMVFTRVVLIIAG